MTRKTSTAAPKAKTRPKATKPVAAKPVDHIFEGVQNMVTAAFTPEKLESYVAELNVKAKAALEKSAKLGEELAELTKGNLEAASESAKVAAKAAETFAAEGAELAKAGYENATAALKRYGTVKTPAELLALNSELAKASFDTALGQASKFGESATKFATDFFQPLSARAAIAADKIKAAVNN